VTKTLIDAIESLKSTIEKSSGEAPDGGDGGGEGGDGGEGGEGNGGDAEATQQERSVSLASKAGLPEFKLQPGESEIDGLRRWRQEIEERAAAKSMVEGVMRGVATDMADREERMKHYAVEAIKDTFGGDTDISAAVERVLKGQRSASRFVGQAAEKSLIETVGLPESASKGVPSGWARTGYAEEVERYGGAGVVDSQRGINVGADRELQQLVKRAMPVAKGGEGLGIGQFISLLSRTKFQDALVSDAEQRFFTAMRQKALAEGTPSAGGVLVPREYMDDLLGLLRAQAVVRRANPRIQRFQKEMYQTSVSTGATAFYTQENAQIPISEETFAEAPLLTPKNLTALVPASNYLLRDAAEAEDFVRRDLAEVLALREDLAFLRGTGTLGEPRGFRNIVGITLDPLSPGAGGLQLSLANIRRIRAVFRSQNAGAVRPVWFFNPEFLTYLETLEEMSGGSPTGRTLLDAETITYNDEGLTSGRFDGVPFFSTTQLPNGTTGGNPTTELYLVNMAETILGENQELEIDLSREASYWDGAAWVSAFQNNQTVFRAVMRHDIAHRRPSQIIVQTGARTT
jgi:HK97 family phage major capsid protein